MSTEEHVAEEVPRSEPADPMLGKVLNSKFKVVSMLATGGMGTIYRGEQLPLGRPVAIKVLIPNLASRQLDPNFHKRFFLEASILARLQHPNIVTVFDYGRIEDTDQERYFMAMEYLEGETLFRRVRRMGRLPPPEAMRIARQIARGLREAHKHGVVHRDLKPSNVMLVSNEDHEEAVKILDFGLVKVLSDDSEELTQQGAFLGSPRFMSPEQISHGKVDLRTDVYSLGIILYQMLCGKVPFESDKSIQILMAHLQQPVPRLKERNPDVEIPEPLEALVMSCLAKDPDGRPATMDALIQGLGDCARGMGVSSAFTSAQITGFDSMPGVPVSPRSSTLRALKDAVTLPAPIEGEEERTSGVPPSADRKSTPGAQNKEETSTPATAVSGSPKADGFARAPSSPSEQRPGSGRKTAIFVVSGVALVGALVFTLTRPPPPAPTPPVQATAPVDTGPKTGPTFTLIIESIPSGASVMEDGKELGTTPLHLSIMNDQAREAPRRLTVQKEGFQPYSIVQGPSEESVRLLATLTEVAAPPPTTEPSADSTSKAPKGATWHPKPRTTPSSTATATAKPIDPPPDIRSNR